MYCDAALEAHPSETILHGCPGRDRTPLRQRGLLAWARGPDGSGAPRLWIVPAAGAPRDEAGRALDRIAESHAAVRSPFVPSVAVHVPGERVALACDPVTDLEEVMGWLKREGSALAYSAGVALNEVLMDAVEAAHRQGIFFGALCFASVVIGPRGETWLVGGGHNFPAPPGGGPHPGLARAPELASWQAPTAASDVYVLYHFIRHLLQYCEMPAVLTGASRPVDDRSRAIHGALTRLTAELNAFDPAARPQSVGALRERYREIRSLSQEMPYPDAGALRGLLGRAAAALGRGAGEEGSAAIVLRDKEARRVRLGACEVDLARKGPLRRLLHALVQEAVQRPGAPLSVDDLLGHGWPGEAPRGQTGRARVYVAISTLRKLGLERVLRKQDDGYLLDPEVKIALPGGDGAPAR